MVKVLSEHVTDMTTMVTQKQCFRPRKRQHESKVKVLVQENDKLGKRSNNLGLNKGRQKRQTTNLNNIHAAVVYTSMGQLMNIMRKVQKLSQRFQLFSNINYRRTLQILIQMLATDILLFYGNSYRPVLLRFVRRTMKIDIIRARQTLKDTSKNIRENLTYLYAKLLLMMHLITRINLNLYGVMNGKLSLCFKIRAFYSSSTFYWL